MMGAGNNMAWHSGWQMGWMGFGGILLVLCVLVLTWISFRSRTNPRNETPETILKQRLAAGEISNEEYTVKLKHLNN